MIIRQKDLLNVKREENTLKSPSEKNLVGIMRGNSQFLPNSFSKYTCANDPVFGLSAYTMEKFGRSKGELDAFSVSLLAGTNSASVHPALQVNAIENFVRGSHRTKNELFAGQVYLPNFEAPKGTGGAKLEIIKFGYMTTSNDACDGMVFRFNGKENSWKASLIHKNLIGVFGKAFVNGNRDEPVRSSPTAEKIKEKINDRFAPDGPAEEINAHFDKYLRGGLSLERLLHYVKGEIDAYAKKEVGARRMELEGPVSKAARKLFKEFNDSIHLFGESLNTVFIGIFKHDSHFHEVKKQQMIAEVLHESAVQIRKESVKSAPAALQKVVG